MDTKADGYACPRCTVGRCTPQKTSFAEIYLDQLLCIPNVTAFVCDVCHLVEFERDMLESLWQELYGDAPVDDIQSVPSHKRSPTYGEGSS